MDSTTVVNDYWAGFASGDKFGCPWCGLLLKKMVSGAASKNPGRAFVSCNKDYHGCGLFCFLDDKPNEKFNPNNKTGGNKRPAGTTLAGPVAKAPSVQEDQLARIQTDVTKIKSILCALAAAQNIKLDPL
jgi:hypothetical protein